MNRLKLTNMYRFLLYSGMIVQISYIMITPFMEIPSFILFSTAFIMTAAFIDLSFAKKELELNKNKHEQTWDEKRKKLQNYYSDETNLNRSFSECLKSIQVEDKHNDRISKILDNYKENNKKFKIKLNRNPENRMDKYLQE